MLKFYIARVLAYLAARMAIPTIWYFKPRLFLPWIEFNGYWMGRALEYLVGAVSPQWSSPIRSFLWLIGRVEKLILFLVQWRTDKAMRDHVEVLAKAFFTPGGWLLVAQLTFVIFVMIRVWQYLRKRRRARRVERAACKKQVPVTEKAHPRLPPAPQLTVPPRRK